MENNCFGKRLRILRLERNLTQKQLAEIFNTTVWSISDWKLGNAEPKLDVIKQITKFFGVKADYLFGICEK